MTEADGRRTGIALCLPMGNRGSGIDPACARSMRCIARDLEHTIWHTFDVCGHDIVTARNELTAMALAEPDVDYLAWIDDDMVFSSDAILRLLQHRKPFVGGLCHDRRSPFRPVLARYRDAAFGFDPESYAWLFDYLDNSLVEVDATGGAFLLIHRKVFEAVRAKFGGGDASWKGWWTPPPQVGASEDLAFCRRAKACGFQIFVDTSVKIGHIGAICVDEDFAKRNRPFTYQAWEALPQALLDAVTARRPGYGGPPKSPELDPTWASRVRILDGTPENADAPVASIVIAAYNSNPAYLQGAVLSALAQTVPVEVIVVDDASTPPVSEILAPGLLEKVRLIRHDVNKGISAAFNTGIEAMTTDWFCWLAHDDQFQSQKTELQLAALLSTDTLCGFAGYDLKKDNKNSVLHVNVPRWSTLAAQNRALWNGCCINASTVMIHKFALDKVRLPNGEYFDTTLKYAQDWEMWCRLGQKFLWFGIPDKLGIRREFSNLTEELKRTKNPRKHEEDRIVRERYSTPCPCCGRTADPESLRALEAPEK